MLRIGMMLVPSGTKPSLQRTVVVATGSVGKLGMSTQTQHGAAQGLPAKKTRLAGYGEQATAWVSKVSGHRRLQLLPTALFLVRLSHGHSRKTHGAGQST
ncbi:MAG: hypothetical protein ACOYNF_04360 [Rhodoferax sp.]